MDGLAPLARSARPWAPLIILVLLASGPMAAAQAQGRACLATDASEGKVIFRTRPSRDCVPLEPRQTIRGLWTPRLESSGFREGASALSEAQPGDFKVWLETDNQTKWPARPPNIQDDRVYRITFVGRRARDMNRNPMEGYGHMGMWRGMILVDEFLEITDMGAAPQ